ncbi:MAG: DUF1223 domain-containing protein, partial [Afipia sp.]|nr:DUF1223 domain-containing protein [Afipia sp.]
VVVNGATQARGSDRNDIDRAIAQSQNQSSVLMVPVSLALVEGKLTAKVPAGKTGNERAEVWLCPIMKTVPVEITRGENKGHTFTYHNVVRRWIKIGDWNGTAQTWTVPVKDFQTGGVDHVAVLVQSGSLGAPGPMLAAAMLPLK